MSIEDRNLKPGTVLVARYKKQDHRCEVVKAKDGKVVYRVKGKEYGSPSAAGSAVMDGTACNGWRFWSLDGDLPARKAATTPKAAKKASAKAKPVSKPKAKAKAAPKPAKRAKQPKAEKNGALPAKPIACGHCGQEFPDRQAAAEHMKAVHGAPEAAGSGGR
jgi:hypothetical protein